MPEGVQSHEELTTTLRRVEYLPVLREVLIPLVKLCPLCLSPVTGKYDPTVDRIQRCQKCRKSFSYSDALIALDESELDKAFTASNSFLDRLFVLKRNYPLVKNGKLKRGMRGRIKAQKGG
jgi:hypothetical protein